MAKKLYIEIDEEIQEMDLSSVVSHFASEFKEQEGKSLPDYEADTPGTQVCEFFIEGVIAESGPPNWENFEAKKIDKEYQALFKIIEDSLGGGNAKKWEEEYKKQAAQEKEKEKSRKEEEEKKAEKRKEMFALSAESGIEKAREKFKEELSSLKESLPEGVELVTNDAGGASLQIGDNAKEEDIASFMTFCAAQSKNTEYLANQLQFVAGDAVNATVELGIYRNRKEASKYISASLEKSDLKYRLNAGTIENYARMADRIDPEMRSIEVDPSAYFAIASAATPKQEKGEKKEDWEKRVKEHAEDRHKILEKMKEGKATVTDESGKELEVDTRSRANILPLVENLQIKHGLKKAVDPTELSVQDCLKQFFWATCAKDYLLGVVEEDVCIFRVPDKYNHPQAEEIEIADGSTIKIVRLTVDELTDYQEQAKTTLENVLLSQQGITMKEFLDGETTAEIKLTKEVEGKEVPDKDPITKKQKVEEVTIPAYPNFPFKNASVTKEEEKSEAAA